MKIALDPLDPISSNALLSIRTKRCEITDVKIIKIQFIWQIAPGLKEIMWWKLLTLSNTVERRPPTNGL